jgi:maltose-binding protein MalE
VITVWTDSALAPVVESLAESFTASTGVIVEVAVEEFISIRGSVLRASADGAGPDLFVGAHAWTGELLDAGAIQPVTGLTSLQLSSYVDSALMGFTLDGKRYGIPYAMETITLWTNITATGPDLPTTLDELLDICDDLPEESTCIAAAGGAGEPDAFYHFPFLSGYGASLFQYEPGIGYSLDVAGVDSAEAITGAELIADLSRGNYLPPLDYLTAKERFEEGQAAFWLTGPWERDDIAAAADIRGFEFSAIVMPEIDGGTPRPFVESQGFFLSAAASPAASEFLVDVLASGTAQRQLSEVTGRLPTHAVALTRIFDPATKAFADAASRGIPTPNVAGMSEDVWVTWGRALTEIRDREADPQLALESAAREIRRLMGIPPPPPPTTVAPEG